MMDAEKSSRTGSYIMKNVQNYKKDEIYFESEQRTNALAWLIIAGILLIYIVDIVLNYLGVFAVDPKSAYMGFLVITLAAGAAFYFSEFRDGRNSPKMKYYLLTVLIITAGQLYAEVGIVSLFIVPVLLSCRYGSKTVTIFASVLTTLVMVVSYSASSFVGVLDLNIATPYQGTVIHGGKDLLYAVVEAGINHQATFRNCMLENFLPDYFFLMFAQVLCIGFTINEGDMLKKQVDITRRNASISTELKTATEIQFGMLPTDFEEFSEGRSSSVYAAMIPAREVGGDFYDYFPADEENSVYLIGDVSGKGVPAALFMSTAKICLRDNLKNGFVPADAYTSVNDTLCYNNEGGMFVTSWCGMINNDTGHMTFVNAGHNPPVHIKASGEISFIKTRPNLFLAGLEGIQYHQEEMDLEPGDRVLLYTDGVTEATNADRELYGEERLIEYLKANSGKEKKTLLEGLRNDVDNFQKDAGQFDDITMLLFEYTGKNSK